MYTTIQRFITIFTLLIVTFTMHYSWASADSRVLMVVSSNGKDKGQTAPGYEFDEFAKAYLVFKANGIEVDIASPKGGAVEADNYDPSADFNAPVLADQEIMQKLNETLPISTVNAAEYAGVFVVGGKGAMFDLPIDTALQTLIADIYQQQGVIAAVCHGPAALVHVKLANGEYLVAGKTVNGFTNEEEQLFGKKWLAEFDFLLEDKLKARGGKFAAAEIMLEYVAVDERLITGQNPTSTVAAAEAMVAELGLTPVAMPTFRDDYTLALVADLLAGDKTAAIKLSQGSEQLHIELVGMYGYYFLNVAEDDKELQQALTLMQLGQSAINNPNLDIQIAKTQQQLGDTVASTQTLRNILDSHPDFTAAQELLTSITQ
ncbi:type 1 glutamine amidotransferase domain-containing protein [Alteromonas flava]|uniref:type 1 glutamine amidotransferase domain-containing protein n=1 Tax=Alteromonas flava TaxID=2048003 RepID=UPI000C28B5CB|nr:type 1 glutamine amidotransferase domain-containing protein [Alteromonas flava]